MRANPLITGLGLLALAGCAVRSPPPAAPPTPAPLPAPPTPAPSAAAACVQYGTASWYRPARMRRRTADGRHPAPRALTAAHPFLPFGTAVRVTDIETGRSVNVHIDDRGPFVRGRIIDLSAAAAHRLGMGHDGVARVRLIATPGRTGPLPHQLATAVTGPCTRDTDAGGA